MKKLLLASLLLASVASPSAAAPQAFAAEPVASSYSQPAAEATPFTLIIVGTRHYSDVDVMRRNIARIPLMRRFVQAVSSQKHIQFLGLFGGTEEGLLEDIRGLASDRFDVGIRKDRTLGLVVTLKKMEAKEE